MKTLLFVFMIALITSCTSVKPQTPETTAQTQKKPHANGLPTEEHAFVDAVAQLDKQTIVDNLGEPAKAEDVRIKDTDRVVASIWEYHYINTDADGKYFPITELSFIDDKVVQVAFINFSEQNDSNKDGRIYELPENKPQQ